MIILVGIVVFVLSIMFVLGLGQDGARREEAAMVALTVHQMEEQFEE